MPTCACAGIHDCQRITVIGNDVASCPPSSVIHAGFLFYTCLWRYSTVLHLNFKLACGKLVCILPSSLSIFWTFANNTAHARRCVMSTLCVRVSETSLFEYLTPINQAMK